MKKITKEEAIEMSRNFGYWLVERPGCGWARTDWNDIAGYYIDDPAAARKWWWSKTVAEQAYCDIASELDQELGEFARLADLSNTVRHLRQRSKMTQADFSSAYGIPMRTFQRWENGETTPPEYVVQLLSRAVAEDFASPSEQK